MDPELQGLIIGFAVGWCAAIGFCIVTLEWFMRQHHWAMRFDEAREGRNDPEEP